MLIYRIFLSAIFFISFYPIFLILCGHESRRPDIHKPILTITNIVFGLILIVILFQPIHILVKLLFIIWKAAFLGYTLFIWKNFNPNLKPFIFTTVLGTICYIIMFTLWVPGQWLSLIESFIYGGFAIVGHWLLIKYMD